ncbi:MAG: AlkA N-terminal domain-containing protein [Luteimonas sp.]
MASPHSTLPDPHVCEQARLSRDPRFDGLFFTAVTSTRIYCRPVCPAPWAKRVTYFANAASAEAAGFRPCLRCRPELSPDDGSWRRGDAVLARALKLIDQGALADQPLSALAKRVDIGERQLRRLFVERLGAAPIGVHGTRRLLFSKQLLTETTLPITEVALAAGFGSLRRFNAAFRDAYRMAPRDLRRKPPPTSEAQSGETLTLRLGYRPPYDFAAMLAFLRGRALPGVEVVDDVSYARVVASAADDADGAGWLRVSAWQNGEHALKLETHGLRSSRLLEVVQRLRRMFDLDAEPVTISAALSASPRLRPLLQRSPGLRLPSGWDGFEIAVRAILGQQVSVAAARTLAARVAQQFGEALPPGLGAPGLEQLFPTPERLADADLASIGLTRARADTVRTIARALLDGSVDFQVERTLENFTARWVALPGVGPWTAHYIAMRALGHPDAFPADDLVLQKNVPRDGTRLSAKALEAQAEAWRPWRAYAVIHIWRDSMVLAPKSLKAAAVANQAVRAGNDTPTRARKADATLRGAHKSRAA